MKGVRAAVRYAKALKQLAQEKNVLDTVIADVKLIHNTVSKNRELDLLLKSPLVNGEKKASILSLIFEKNIDQMTMTFMNQIVTQKRENLLKVICEEFINQYNELKGIAKVSVTTPLALTQEIREDLIKKITAQYNLSQVELDEHVDASLIGGMVLRIGDRQLDASIRRQLNDIKQELIHA